MEKGFEKRGANQREHLSLFSCNCRRDTDFGEMYVYIKFISILKIT